MSPKYYQYGFSGISDDLQYLGTPSLIAMNLIHHISQTPFQQNLEGVRQFEEEVQAVNCEKN